MSHFWTQKSILYQITRVTGQNCFIEQCAAVPGTMCLVSISLVFANQLLMYFKMLQIPLKHETIVPCSVWRYLLFLLLLQESCIAHVIEPIIKSVDRAVAGVWHLDLVLRGCPPPFSSSHSGLKLPLLSNTVWELLTLTACQHRAYSAKYWFNHQKAWKCVSWTLLLHA